MPHLLDVKCLKMPHVAVVILCHAGTAMLQIQTTLNFESLGILLRCIQHTSIWIARALFGFGKHYLIKAAKSECQKLSKIVIALNREVRADENIIFHARVRQLSDLNIPFKCVQWSFLSFRDNKCSSILRKNTSCKLTEYLFRGAYSAYVCLWNRAESGRTTASIPSKFITIQKNVSYY